MGELLLIKTDVKEIRDVLRDQLTVDDTGGKIKIPNVPIRIPEKLLLLEEYTKQQQQANSLVNIIYSIATIVLTIYMWLDHPVTLIFFLF